MGIQVIDGKGTGSAVQVKDNVLATDAMSSWERAARRGDAWIIPNATADIDAGDTVLLAKNSSTTRNLHVWKVTTSFLSATVTESEIIIHRPTTTFTLAGTAVTPVNAKGGITDNGEVTAKGDETGNTQGDFLDHAIVNEHVEFTSQMNGGIILTPGQSIGVDVVDETTEVYCTIWAYFEDT